MYDASGVRLHAGKQASVLNMIITELPPDHPVSDTRPLRDTLGHTPLQVQMCVRSFGIHEMRCIYKIGMQHELRPHGL